jgi:hypothetical protein
MALLDFLPDGMPETAEAFADPRPGDVFHEMYTFGTQVRAVDGDDVYWREFNTAEIRRGVCTREEWARKYLYGGTSSVQDRYWVRLSTRGEA